MRFCPERRRAAPLIVVPHQNGFIAFEHPETVLECRTAAGLPDLLRQLDAASANGMFLAGFLAYEAAAGLDLATRAPDPDGPPLAWFGAYSSPRTIPPPSPAGMATDSAGWRPAIEAGTYANAIRAVQAHIAAGDTYQVNFTFPMVAPYESDPWSLFVRLVAAQPSPNAAFVDLGRYVIVSASPEMFFSVDGEVIEARPMKGTASRGRSPIDDDRAAAALRASPKDRAENLMIVDMLRNDLGRIAQIGSVSVPALFEIERYPTLFQMTSTVRARTRAGTGEILSALFPCASVTGAPKKRTMEIIASLETVPRGVYTGAIGWIAPDRRTHFSVAIRTVTIDRDRALATYGVGSGIVADSVAQAEYAECLLKARVLTEPYCL